MPIQILKEEILRQILKEEILRQILKEEILRCPFSTFIADAAFLYLWPKLADRRDHPDDIYYILLLKNQEIQNQWKN